MSHPFGSMRFANHTIAASAGGTAAATILGTISATTITTVKEWQVFNLSLRNVELFIAEADPGTAKNGIFVPGTAANIPGLGMGVRAPIAISGGSIIRARTTENTPVTLSATLPLYINLWG